MYYQYSKTIVYSDHTISAPGLVWVNIGAVNATAHLSMYYIEQTVLYRTRLRAGLHGDGASEWYEYYSKITKSHSNLKRV